MPAAGPPRSERPGRARMSRDCHIHPFPRLVPALTLLAQLLARGTSVTDIAPVVPLDGLGSNDTFSLSS